MNRFIRVIPIAASLLASSVVQASAQEVHEIRMVGSAKGEFRFEPASFKTRRGDVLLFRAVGGGPHSAAGRRNGRSPPSGQAPLPGTRTHPSATGYSGHRRDVASLR